MAYIDRITDPELQRKLQAAGAVLIRGAKAGGQTEYAAFEFKLGTGQIDVAAANLTKFAAVIDTTKTKAPQSLNIITGSGIS